MATRKPKADKAAEETAAEPTITASEVLDVEIKTSDIAAFNPFYSQLAELEKNNSLVVFDYESKKGNTEARSHIHKLRKTRAALESARKDQKAEYIRLGKLIDVEAGEIELRIIAMIDVHQKKIDEIEEKEAARVKAISDKIESIKLFGEGVTTSDEMKHQISLLEELVIDETYGDFKEAALELKDDHLRTLRGKLTIMQKAEADAIELEKLRRESAERERQDNEKRIAEAAAQKAREDAQAEIAERERLAAKAIADAEALAKSQAEAAAKRELELKLAAEQSERLRLEQAQKAAQDAKDAAEKAEHDKAIAIQQEQKRAAQEAANIASEAKRREENKSHAKKINNAAMQAIMDGGKVTQEQATAIVIAIVKGQVPNVVINY